jgi:5-carboxymethyl-2-hydroxymuconate isomerase
MHYISLKGVREPIPVGKILCLGQNYAAHAREMKSDVPSRPIVFLKPSSAIISDGETVIAPVFSQEVHHEVELVVLIGKNGKNISRESALEYIDGYGVGLDMTMRDVQREARNAGQPWTVAKGFDTSAPLSEFVPRTSIPDPHSLSIRLSVNGKERQHANTNEMIFRIDEVISYLSSIFTLERGDLIYTGTPEGVGTVIRGDILRAEIESIGSLTVHVQ